PQPGDQILTAQRIGTCDPDRILIRTPEGTGCVERVAWIALTAAFSALEEHPPEQMADRRPLPFEPARLELQTDGTILIELGGHPRVAGQDADPDRIRELVVALTTPGERVPRPAGKPRGALVAIASDGSRVTLELYPQVVVRQGEPVAIRTPLLQTITRPVTLLRDPTRWREDPTTITSMTVDGITYTRGAVLGEWTRTPTGTVDPALVEALASALAVVRAPGTPASPTALHHVAVVFTPPAGSPVTHTIELAGQTEGGCAGRIDGSSVAVPLQLCTAVLALHAVR
ncbi:MAG TPA: hypothetical protein VLB44_14840, partial [Kofleriaceae bacterium]|nr:hypothetical protein [Kofleriaceae bacterium]